MPNHVCWKRDRRGSRLPQGYWNCRDEASQLVFVVAVLMLSEELTRRLTRGLGLDYLGGSRDAMEIFPVTKVASW